MSLESLVDEIRRRGEADLAAITASRDAEAAKIVADRDMRVAEIRTQSARTTEAEVSRERAQRLAAAKLQARKQLYEVRERRLDAAIGETKKLLQEYTRSPQYPTVLRRMVTAASESLGKQVRISGRAEDSSVLAKAAGKNFDPTPQPILGGVLAETPDGSRRLSLSFDELLRLHEDRVRELLA